jgi:hypothetical protein
LRHVRHSPSWREAVPRLPFGQLWYSQPNAARNAVSYAMHNSRSHDAVIRVYDAAGNVIETHEAQRRFQRVVAFPPPWREYRYGTVSGERFTAGASY